MGSLGAGIGTLGRVLLRASAGLFGACFTIRYSINKQKSDVELAPRQFLDVRILETVVNVLFLPESREICKAL